MEKTNRLTSTSLSPRSNLWNHTSVPDDDDDDDDDDDEHDHWGVIHAAIHFHIPTENCKNLRSPDADTGAGLVSEGSLA